MFCSVTRPSGANKRWTSWRTLALLPVKVSGEKFGGNHHLYHHAGVLGVTRGAAPRFYLFHVRNLDNGSHFALDSLDDIRDPSSTIQLMPTLEGQYKLDTWKIAGRLSQLHNQSVRYALGGFDCQTITNFVCFDVLFSEKAECGEQGLDVIGWLRGGASTSPVSATSMGANVGTVDLGLPPPLTLGLLTLDIHSNKYI